MQDSCGSFINILSSNTTLIDNQVIDHCHKKGSNKQSIYIDALANGNSIITTQTLIKRQLTAKKMKRKTHERHTCSSRSTAMVVLAKVPKDTTAAYAHAQLSVIKFDEMTEQTDTVLYNRAVERRSIFV